MRFLQRPSVITLFVSAGAAAIMLPAFMSGPARAFQDGAKGAPVGQLCFTRNVDRWREAEDGSLLVERRLHEWFLVEFNGPCDLSYARLTLILTDRGAGRCLDAGDTIAFDDAGVERHCTIRRIYEWNEEAARKGGAEKPYDGGGKNREE